MTKKILFFITLISFFIRLYDYKYPPLLWDEAATGYNAYSILKTGRDEHGQLLPLIFKSFGDYKPGVYIYLCLPFIALFGLNELSVRLPSIIAGSLLPLLFYLLIIKIFPKYKRIATISAVLVCFNPWNIHFSRGAWETNILLFELVLGSLLFLNKRFILSATIFGLSFYTYQAGKLMVPFFIFFLYLQTKYFSKKFFLTMLFLSLPLIYGLMFGSDANRLKVMSLYNYKRPESESLQIQKESNITDYLIFHSHFPFFIRNVITRYFNYFSPQFLFFQGDWQTSRHSAPYIGVFLYPILILFPLGLLFCLSRFSKYKFFLLWLFLSSLPAAFSRDIIQPVRSIYFSLPVLFFSALSLSRIKNKFITLSFFLFFSLSFLYYQELYYHHMTKIKPDQWLVGYRQAINYFVDNSSDRELYFTDFYGQPYIYYLFYTKYSPSLYQSQSQYFNNGIDVGSIRQLDNIKFTSPNISQLIQSSKPILAIISFDEIVRQGFDISQFINISPLFYAYKN